jgi:hypothetical protein
MPASPRRSTSKDGSQRLVRFIQQNKAVREWEMQITSWGLLSDIQLTEDLLTAGDWLH